MTSTDRNRRGNSRSSNSRDPINFGGLSRKDIFTAYSSDICNSLTRPEIEQLPLKLLQNQIISDIECRSNPSSVELCTFILAKGEDQIESFLNIVAAIPSKKAIRRKILEDIAQRNQTLQEGEVPSASQDQPQPSIEQVELLPLSRNQSGSDIGDCRILIPGSSYPDIEDTKQRQEQLKAMAYPTAFMLLFLIVCLPIVYSLTRNSHSPPHPPEKFTNSNTTSVDENIKSLANIVENANVTNLTLPKAPSNTNSPTSALAKKSPGNRKTGKKNTTTPNPMSTTTYRHEPAELENLKKVFQPSTGTTMLIDDVRSTRYFQNSICHSNDKPFKTLNFTLDRPYRDKDLNLTCRERVTGLEISGSLSLDNLYNLLSNFPSLQYLSISNKSICESIEEGMDSLELDSKSMEILVLTNLTFLKFSNLPECSPLYSFLSNYVETPNLTTLVMETVFVSVSNADFIDKLFRGASSLENFKFVGNLCAKCQLFKRGQGWVNLKTLDFVVKTSTEENAVKSLKKVLKVAKDLRYISSNVHLANDKNNTKLFLRFVNVKYLNLTIDLPDDKVSFSARFFSVFPHLSESYILLVFSDSSICKSENKTVKLTNLEKYVGTSKIQTWSLSSNCKIVALKGWKLPCREYDFEKDPVTLVHTTNLTKCSDCILGGCKR